MIPAGRRDKRVTIQTPSVVSDDLGQAINTWGTLATVWAAVKPLTGDQRLAAQQVDATASHTVTILYRADVTPKMRVLYGSRILEIQAVMDPDERHEQLELACAEVVL